MGKNEVSTKGILDDEYRQAREEIRRDLANQEEPEKLDVFSLCMGALIMGASIVAAMEFLGGR